MKKILFFLFLTAVLFPMGIFAQRPLEVDYPAISGYEITETTVPFGNYIKYIYIFTIIISGFIGLGVLVWAGFRYLTSSGNPERMGEAKNWITSCLIGLLIIFLSWIIVNTINPQLTVLEQRPIIPFVSDIPKGVILCEKQVDINRAWDLVLEYKNLEISTDTIDERDRIKEEYEDIMQEVLLNCVSRVGAATGFTKDFKYLYLVPAEEKRYGAILFEENGFGGKMQMFMPVEGSQSVLDRPVEKLIKLGNVASMYSFGLNPNPDPSWSVTLYSEQNFNYLVGAPCAKYSSGSGNDPKNCSNTEISWIQSVAISPKYSVASDLQGKSPESIEINGDLLVVLIKNPGATAADPGEYVVKIESDPTLLNDDPIITLKPSVKGGFEPVAAAQSMIIISYSTGLIED